MTPESMLEHAERLLPLEDTEENHRTVTSRAYFAAFHGVLEHEFNLGNFRKSGSGDDHRALIEELKRAHDPTRRTLGMRFLPRLRALRNRADYEFGLRFARELADDALEDATEILRMIAPK
jgi:uncharacterized protein (UPF0332 family)